MEVLCKDQAAATRPGAHGEFDLADDVPQVAASGTSEQRRKVGYGLSGLGLWGLKFGKFFGTKALTWQLLGASASPAHHTLPLAVLRNCASPRKRAHWRQSL